MPAAPFEREFAETWRGGLSSLTGHKKRIVPGMKVGDIKSSGKGRTIIPPKEGGNRVQLTTGGVPGDAGKPVITDKDITDFMRYTRV